MVGKIPLAARRGRILLIVFSCYIFVSVLLYWGLSPVDLQYNNQTALFKIGLFYSSLVLIAIVGTMLIERIHTIHPEDLGMDRGTWTRWTVALCIGTVVIGLPLVAGVSWLWTTLLVSVFHMTTDSRVSLLMHYSVGSVQEALMVGSITILAPFCEEVMMRGFVLRWLLEVCPTWVAVVLSAALFSLGHWQLVNAGSTFASGLILALLYLYTRSIWPSLLWHLLPNTLFVVAFFAR